MNAEDQGSSTLAAIVEAPVLRSGYMDPQSRIMIYIQLLYRRLLTAGPGRQLCIRTERRLRNSVPVLSSSHSLF